MSAECPECGATVTLPDGVVEGEVIECPNCAAELDVVSLNPVELMVFEEEEK